MVAGVDIVVGLVTLKNQLAVSGIDGNDSLASGIYQKIETYDNDITDVKKMEAFQVGASRAAVIILHD